MIIQALWATIVREIEKAVKATIRRGLNRNSNIVQYSVTISRILTILKASLLIGILALGAQSQWAFGR